MNISKSSMSKLTYISHFESMLGIGNVK